MQISIENTSGLEREMSVGIEAFEVDDKVETKLKELARTISIKGFRPGKVPLKYVSDRYRKSVRLEIIDEVVKNKLHEAMVQESVRPAAMLGVKINQDKDGKPLEFTAKYEIYPTITDLQIETIGIERPDVTISELDVDNAIERLRYMDATWQEATGKTAKGSRVTFDAVITINNDVVEEQSDAVSILGVGSLLPDFEAGLMGLELGSQNDFKVHFPSSHPNFKLADKDAAVNVTVQKIESATLPELDDAILSSTGY